MKTGGPSTGRSLAHSLEDEKAAFCSFMHLVAERRRRWPEMHVYDYGGYESGALKRLMSRHAVREDDLDVLLRGRVLVDLYSVLRQGVRVSDEWYSPSPGSAFWRQNSPSSLSHHRSGGRPAPSAVCGWTRAGQARCDVYGGRDLRAHSRSV